MGNEDWSSYCKLVMAELERLNSVVIQQETLIVLNKVDIAQLKIKAGAWGLLGGLIPAACAFIYWLIKTKV